MLITDESSQTSLSVLDWQDESILFGKDGDLWVYPLHGDRKAFAVTQTTFTESRAVFSPDGRWIAYSSNESGRMEVFVMPFPFHGESKKISRDGGVTPTWNGDGTELFFLDLHGNLMAARVQTPKSFNSEIPKALFPTDLPTTYSLSGTYGVSRDGQSFLIPLRINPGAPEPITAIMNWESRIRSQSERELGGGRVSVTRANCTEPDGWVKR